jgi:uncharacterized glyoxalase superfamily protein PhnB
VGMRGATGPGRAPGSRAGVRVDRARLREGVFRQAVTAGGKPIREVSTQDYGDRTGGVEDPAGNQGWIATRLAARPGGGDG